MFNGNRFGLFVDHTGTIYRFREIIDQNSSKMKVLQQQQSSAGDVPQIRGKLTPRLNY